MRSTRNNPIQKKVSHIAQKKSPTQRRLIKRSSTTTTNASTATATSPSLFVRQSRKKASLSPQTKPSKTKRQAGLRAETLLVYCSNVLSSSNEEKKDSNNDDTLSIITATIKTNKRRRAKSTNSSPQSKNVNVKRKQRSTPKKQKSPSVKKSNKKQAPPPLTPPQQQKRGRRKKKLISTEENGSEIHDTESMYEDHSDVQQETKTELKSPVSRQRKKPVETTVITKPKSKQRQTIKNKTRKKVAPLASKTIAKVNDELNINTRTKREASLKASAMIMQQNEIERSRFSYILADTLANATAVQAAAAKRRRRQSTKDNSHHVESTTQSVEDIDVIPDTVSPKKELTLPSTIPTVQTVLPPVLSSTSLRKTSPSSLSLNKFKFSVPHVPPVPHRPSTNNASTKTECAQSTADSKITTAKKQTNPILSSNVQPVQSSSSSSSTTATSVSATKYPTLTETILAEHDRIHGTTPPYHTTRRDNVIRWTQELLQYSNEPLLPPFPSEQVPLESFHVQLRSTTSSGDQQPAVRMSQNSNSNQSTTNHNNENNGGHTGSIAASTSTTLAGTGTATTGGSTTINNDNSKSSANHISAAERKKLATASSRQAVNTTNATSSNIVQPLPPPTSLQSIPAATIAGTTSSSSRPQSFDHSLSNQSSTVHPENKFSLLAPPLAPSPLPPGGTTSLPVQSPYTTAATFPLDLRQFFPLLSCWQYPAWSFQPPPSVTGCIIQTPPPVQVVQQPTVNVVVKSAASSKTNSTTAASSSLTTVDKKQKHDLIAKVVKTKQVSDTVPKTEVKPKGLPKDHHYHLHTHHHHHYNHATAKKKQTLPSSSSPMSAPTNTLHNIPSPSLLKSPNTTTITTVPLSPQKQSIKSTIIRNEQLVETKTILPLSVHNVVRKQQQTKNISHHNLISDQQSMLSSSTYCSSSHPFSINGDNNEALNFSIKHLSKEKTTLEQQDICVKKSVSPKSHTTTMVIGNSSKSISMSNYLNERPLPYTINSIISSSNSTGRGLINSNASFSFDQIRAAHSHHSSSLLHQQLKHLSPINSSSSLIQPIISPVSNILSDSSANKKIERRGRKRRSVSAASAIMTIGGKFISTTSKITTTSPAKSSRATRANSSSTTMTTTSTPIRLKSACVVDSNSKRAQSPSSGSTNIAKKRRKFVSKWILSGEAEIKLVPKNPEKPPVYRECYPSIQHRTQNDVIKSQDCVLLRPENHTKGATPYLAKVKWFWEEKETGEILMSLIWYYHPEHTDLQPRIKEHFQPNEVLASKYWDTVSVACIEDKCYVLTLNEYCRYRVREKLNIPQPWLFESDTIKQLKSILTYSSSSSTSNIITKVEQKDTDIEREIQSETTACRLLPSKSVDNQNIFFCRYVYDFRQKRILKNPNINNNLSITNNNVSSMITANNMNVISSIL
ncbi:unnamed protein product [Didymodactylos carnosus]|uniref:BAH domain-containing protein n=1 Tax=Didymodactylos carnosus TaxID=1234261 RepID=A0A813RPG8_9BILA|nr:unnamed protein product [Didymodactylos carnosus]CAF3567728.1 unnamed protein product [Didymodactylos carnosus]